MGTQTPKPQPADRSAIQPVREAHTLLQSLRDQMDRHPELEQAIEKLEEALNLLAVKTGGML